MRGANCYPGRGERGEIPLLSENVDKRSVNNLGNLQRVTTQIEGLAYMWVLYKCLSTKPATKLFWSLIHKAHLRIWPKFWKFSFAKSIQFYVTKLQFYSIVPSLNYTSRHGMKNITWKYLFSMLFLSLKFGKHFGISLSEHCEWENWWVLGHIKGKRPIITIVPTY